MKKRIAYIGLSYPLLYDYEHQAKKGNSDMWDSPNPIIESPLGLMILYDELWFVCESICPDNMRRLPYVKFVDKLFPDLYFEGALACMEQREILINWNQKWSYESVINSMNLNKLNTHRGLDIHTHQLRVGDLEIAASGTERNILFDIYVFSALQEIVGGEVELVTNRLFNISDGKNINPNVGVVENIVIPNIPNYISAQGPYHECMEELRGHRYLKDFRRWVMESHEHLQKAELTEIQQEVQAAIKENMEDHFMKDLDNSAGYVRFASAAKTIITTGIGMVCAEVSILDALAGVFEDACDMRKVKSERWQGFLVQAPKIVGKI